VPEPDVKDGNAQKSWSFFMGGTPQSPFVSPVFQMDSN
jgi:hypothetical protein